MEKTNSLLAHIQHVYPKANIKYKDESKLMKFLGFFAKPFLTSFTTTLGNTVYFPSRKWAEQIDPWETLQHEAMHIADYNKNPIWFILSYLFPLPLAILALSALGAISGDLWYLLGLVWLLALLPLPAPGRMQIELRGYTMSLAVTYWQYGTFVYTPIQEFTSADYYFMWPFTKNIAKRLDQVKEDIKSRAILKDPIISYLHDWMLFNGFVKY